MIVNFEKINKDVITLALETDYNSDISDANVFASIIAKLYKESTKAGFRNKYNKEERILIQQLHETIFITDGTQNGPVVTEYPNRMQQIEDNEE